MPLRRARELARKGNARERVVKLGSPPAIRGAVVRLSVALALLIALAASNVPSTHAVTASPDGVTATDATGSLIGFDASLPQWGKTIPRTTADDARYGFAVLGVYEGEAFSINHCLAQQYQDALTRGFTPDVYLDVYSATKATAIFGEYGPKGSCLADDRACASYNYGYHSAAVGFRYVGTPLGRDRERHLVARRRDGQAVVGESRLERPGHRGSARLFRIGRGRRRRVLDPPDVESDRGARVPAGDSSVDLRPGDAGRRSPPLRRRIVYRQSDPLGPAATPDLRRRLRLRPLGRGEKYDRLPAPASTARG